MQSIFKRETFGTLPGKPAVWVRHLPILTVSASVCASPSFEKGCNLGLLPGGVRVTLLLNVDRIFGGCFVLAWQTKSNDRIINLDTFAYTGNLSASPLDVLSS
jgi:hypothetical protein